MIYLHPYIDLHGTKVIVKMDFESQEKCVKRTGAVLLAAGMSARMKAFKPMLPFAGTTISRHLVGLLQELRVDPIIVVTGFQAGQLKEHLSCMGVRFIKNERFRETEMFDSVKLGLTAAQKECDRILLLPIDVPGIQKDTIRKSIEAEAILSRPVCRGKPGHPIVMDKSVIPQICRYQGNRGLRGAMEESGVLITDLEVEDEGIYLDADTPEEYKRLVEQKQTIF